MSRLALSPGRQAQLAQSMLQKSLALAQFAGAAVKGGDGAAPQAAGTPYAHRFADPAWSKFPFNVLAQSFITAAELAREAVTGRAGLEPDGRKHRGFHDARRPRTGRTGQLPADQPAAARADAAGERQEPGARHPAPRRGRAAHVQGSRPGRRRELRGRRARRREQGQGRPAQLADGVDPVLTDYPQGLRRAGAGRAGVDHEVLHPRPVARGTRWSST